MIVYRLGISILKGDSIYDTYIIRSLMTKDEMQLVAEILYPKSEGFIVTIVDLSKRRGEKNGQHS